MRIIPAIDIIGGKCVRLTKGDYGTKKIYNENPLEVAKEFEASGIKYLHLVDLDGARVQRTVNHKVLENIALHTSLTIDFGGGIRSTEDMRVAIESGASQVTGGSMAVKNPPAFVECLERFGNEKIILGADAIDRKVATQAWQEQSAIDVVDFIADYEKKGVLYVVCTDIKKDGMLQGVSEVLYTDILQKTNVKLIASGGVSSMVDLQVLSDIGCDGAIIGKAIYENKITLKELSKLC
jgi:phosphoribosylformimino-5-aminoimidazole carboxamide ribotide isomerase